MPKIGKEMWSGRLQTPVPGAPGIHLPSTEPRIPVQFALDRHIKDLDKAEQEKTYQQAIADYIEQSAEARSAVLDEETNPDLRPGTLKKQLEKITGNLSSRIFDPELRAKFQGETDVLAARDYAQLTADARAHKVRDVLAGNYETMYRLARDVGRSPGNREANELRISDILQGMVERRIMDPVTALNTETAMLERMDEAQVKALITADPRAAGNLLRQETTFEYLDPLRRAELVDLADARHIQNMERIVRLADREENREWTLRQRARAENFITLITMWDQGRDPEEIRDQMSRMQADRGLGASETRMMHDLLNQEDAAEDSLEGLIQAYEYRFASEDPDPSAYVGMPGLTKATRARFIGATYEEMARRRAAESAEAQQFLTAADREERENAHRRIRARTITTGPMANLDPAEQNAYANALTMMDRRAREYQAQGKSVPWDNLVREALNVWGTRPEAVYHLPNLVVDTEEGSFVFRPGIEPERTREIAMFLRGHPELSMEDLARIREYYQRLLRFRRISEMSKAETQGAKGERK